MVARKIRHIDVKQLETYAKDVCFIEDENEFDTMLQFYHDLGIIVKHQETVILNAQWLIDLFRQLITIPVERVRFIAQFLPLKSFIVIMVHLTNVVKYSRTSRDLVVAYGRWSLTRVELGEGGGGGTLPGTGLTYLLIRREFIAYCFLVPIRAVLGCHQKFHVNSE